MSLFKFNYNKEGPGVEKDVKKNIFYTYFESYKRNFWNLLKLNFMYAVASIPMIIILAVLFTMFLYPHMEGLIEELASAAQNVDINQARATYLGVFAGIFIVEILLMIGSGPASAAFSYAAKCMANEEHVWLWSDFKGKFIENFRQSIIVAIIDIIVIFIIFNAMYFYLAMYNNTGSVLYFIAFAAIMVFSVVFVLMHGYIYQMIVTFDNKLTVLYKNAFVMAIAKLPQNIFLILIPVLLTYFLMAVITPVLAALLTFTLWIGAMRYPMEFYAARTIRDVIEKNREE